MKIYTKTGDSGSTGLYGGKRISKAHPRIEAYGTVDELNSALGIARCTELGEGVDAVIEQIQHQLFELGSQLATPSDAEDKKAWVTEESIVQIERSIDRFEAALPPLTQFVLPAGCPGAAALHLARTICRRAERCVVRLSEVPDEHVSNAAIVYLNRIGDLLFVLARFANHAFGRADVPWVQPAS
jgi:cob(I)alamin adenosyltransferase